MVSNLKAIYEQGADHPRLLVMADLLIAMSPEDPGLYRDRAACYEAVGHVQGALEDYRRCLALGPDGEQAEEVQERIQALAGAPTRLH
jgi:regulator of sirC expression with transglutaminase-like and TPR domain